MRRVHDSKEVNFEAFEIGRRRSCGIETLRNLECWHGLRDSGICDDGVDSTMRAEFSCCAEEVDLRLYSTLELA